MSKSDVLLLVPVWLLVLGWARSAIALAFYRAYFDRKQRSLGRDPKAVMREQFPLIWWLVR